MKAIQDTEQGPTRMTEQEFREAAADVAREEFEGRRMQRDGAVDAARARVHDLAQQKEWSG